MITFVLTDMDTPPKCLNCKTPMLHREGKFGGFWFCPSLHHKFTMSDKAAAALSSMPIVAVGKQFIRPQTDLHEMVRIRCRSMGGISELEEFYVDIPPDDENEDHWMNIRPY